MSLDICPCLQILVNIPNKMYSNSFDKYSMNGFDLLAHIIVFDLLVTFHVVHHLLNEVLGNE